MLKHVAILALYCPVLILSNLPKCVFNTLVFYNFRPIFIVITVEYNLVNLVNKKSRYLKQH